MVESCRDMLYDGAQKRYAVYTYINTGGRRREREKKREGEKKREREREREREKKIV